MSAEPGMSLWAAVLGAPDAGQLAGFYQRLLHWELVVDEPGWARIQPPGGGTCLSFQSEALYVPPVWPASPGSQQMTAHLDIRVDDLDSASAFAQGLGATLTDYQPQDDVRVLRDPAGNLFCLFTPQ